MRIKFVLNWVCLFALFLASTAWSEVRSLEGNSTDGFYINMPSYGDDALTVTEAEVAAGLNTFTVYDDGGADGNYSDDIIHSCLSLFSPAGYRLQVSGSRKFYDNYDILWIYDNPVLETKLLDDISGSGGIDPVTSTGNSVTVCYTTSSLWNDSGFVLTVTLVESPEPHIISVMQNVEHGSVEPGVASALVGETVNLTAVPDNGYYLRDFSVHDGDGNILYTYDAWYRNVTPSFPMPYADVSVAPVFVDGLTAENGLYITMPYNTVEAYSIPENVVSFHVYDDGGVSGNPSEFASGAVELVAPENYRWLLTGTFAAGNYDGGLTVYDGEFSSSYLVHELHRSDDNNQYEPIVLDTLVSSGRVMSVRFQTYRYVSNNFGMDLVARLIDARPHAITVEPTSLGEISCDESATYGTEATCLAIPEDGAELVSISAIDSDNKPVSLTRGGGLNSNRFTFAMREKPVTIKAAFANENVVTFDENGCLTNGTYFHLECRTGDTPACYLSQEVVENPNEGVTDFKCFYSTFENTRGVVNAFNERRIAKLSLLTDLNLGGYVNGRCAMSAFAPFDLTNAIENDFDGNNHTIKGFCYEGDAQQVGFVLNANVYNVTFDSAHVVANNATNGSQAGVVAWFGPTPFAAIDKVHVKNSYVSGTQAGAIAGSSLITAGSLAITGSSVSNTEVRGLPSTGQSVNISAAGGFVGLAHNLQIVGDSLTNVSVTGAAKMGGLVGYMDVYSDDVETRLEEVISDVKFNGSVGKSCKENSSIGGLVGEVGNPGAAGANLIVLRSMVTSDAGSIVYEEPCSGVTLQNANVGGIVGYVSDAPQSMSLNISHTASIGDISVSGAATPSVGYIAGAVIYSAEQSSADVHYNYHYGDDAVALGVGKIEYYGSDESASTVAEWRLGYNTSGCYFDENVRNGNAVNGLETDGTMGPYEYMVNSAETYFSYMFKHQVDENGVLSAVLTNGVYSDDEMKSGKFAAALNYVGNVDYWTWSENLNGGLPSIIRSTTEKPVYYLYLSIYDYGTDGSGVYVPTIDAAKMNALGIDTISREHDQSNNIRFERYGIAGYTDAAGHANADFVKHYQNVVNDIAATNTVSYSLSLDYLGGESVSRISPITDTTVFVGQARFTMNIRENQTYNVEYVYCVAGSDGPETCSPVEDAGKTIVFLSPRVDAYDNSKDFALVPSAIALGENGNENLETIILGMAEGDVQITQYAYSTEFALFGDVVGEFSRLSDFSEITKIVVKYSAETTPQQMAVVKNPSGVEFDFSVNAYNAVNGVLQTVKTTPVVSEVEEITVPYGVNFVVSGMSDNLVGYKYDSYSLMYKVENGYRKEGSSTYNRCRTIDVVDTLEVDGSSFPSYQQLYQGIEDCHGKAFVISGLGENDEIDLQNVRLAKNFFSEYMTDTFAVVPKYNPVEYTVTFDTVGWQHIYGAADDPDFVPGSAKYEMYIAKDFNSPTTYNLDLKNKKLPIFHAVTQELDDASTGFSAYVASWVYDNDKINCEVGTSGDEYDCVDDPETGDASFDEISEYLISEVTDAGKMGGADMNRSFTLYPVWSGASDERSFILVDCEKTRDYDCVEPPVSLELSQSFTMNGQQYTLKHLSEKSFMGDATIPLPSGRSSEYEFDVNVSVKPGFEVNMDGIYFDTDSSKMNQYINYDAGNKKLYVDGRSNNALKIFMKNSGYSLKDYTVKLDLSSIPEDVGLFVGDGFDTLRTMNLGTAGRKVHAYFKRDGSYYPLTWAAVPDPKADYESGWYENNAYEDLTPALIAKALGDDSDKSTFSVYPQNYYRSYVSGSIITLPPYSNHGNVLLSQTVGGKTSVIYPEEIHFSSEGVYGLLLPGSPIMDTLTFQILLDPEPGYKMTIVECEYSWNDMPEGEDWGCNEDKTQFKYTTEYMANGNYIDVRYDMQHYNIDFVMAETENGKDVYVPNRYVDGRYEMMQYEGQRDVTLETAQTPLLLDAEGCEVGWKVKGREVEERNDPSIVYEMPFMKGMVGADDATIDTLIPDGEFRFCNDDTEYYTMKLVVEGPGTLQMVQKVGSDPVNEGDPEPVYVHHAFKTEDNITYLKIPVVRDDEVEVGVKLMPVAIPEKGSFLKEITYETVVNGNELTVVIEDSASINIMQNLVWHVKFEEYKPLQVAYDLSLGAADSSKVWIPADGMNEGEIALGENESAVEMWKPYRSDSCFVGWSMRRSSERTDDDVIYMALDKDNYEDFSSTGVNKFYAVWMPYGDDCARPTVVNNLNLGYFEGGKPNVLVLMDRSDSLVVTQKFGDAVITHRADSFDDALAYNPAGYDISVLIEMGVSYAPDADSPEILAYAMRRNSDGVQVFALEGDSGVFRVGNTTSSLSYYFGQKEHEIRYNFVYNVNADGANVFYGDNWSSTGQKSFNDSSLAFPKNIYRSDACLMGWSKDAEAETGARELTLEFVETLDATKSVDTLYAVWNECDVNTYTVSFANTNIGSLVLTQDVEDTIVSFDVGEDGLEVPVVEGGLKFRAAYTLKQGYKADSLYIIDEKDGSLTTLVDDSFTVEGDMTFTVPSEAKLFTLVFDVNRNGNVFYGTDWAERKTYRLTDSLTTIPLPMYVYTSDRCMVGWSLSKSGKKTYLQFAGDLVDALQELGSAKDSYTVYAIWGEGSACDGLYDRITLSGKNGAVRLAETESGDMESAVLHDFVNDGTMLLPKTVNGNWLHIVSVPDSSFVLDSLVLTRSGSVERQVFREGNALAFNLSGVNLEMFFGKSNRTEIDFVEPEFAKTGNAVRFTFSTTMFEVTRKASARVRLETIGGELVDEATISDSIVPPYRGVWEKFPLDAGRYILTVTIGDAKQSKEYVTVFDVFAEIASLATEDAWRMISIANLDKESFVWDGDAKFYWWDESSAMGEYWQYREYRPSDDIVATRGYWYGSVEGRPLLLKTENDRTIEKNIVWKLDSVNSGWNMVANPYGFALDLFADHPAGNAEATEDASIRFLRWNPDVGGYRETDALEPYEAVWVEVSRPTEWTIPVVPDFTNKSGDGDKLLGKRLAKATGKNDWRIQAVLADAKGHRDSWNMLGASSRPFVAGKPPEGMGDHVSLSIMDGKRTLAKSVKAPAEEQEWTIRLNASSERLGYLSFVGVDELNALGLKVFVTVDGKTTEMREGTDLKVALGPNGNYASVRVAKSAKVVADLHIDGVRFTQAGRTLDVSFNASADLAGSRSVVDVLNMDGKVVASRSGKILAGMNALTLETPRGGVYMLRVRAGSQMNVSRILVK